MVSVPVLESIMYAYFKHNHAFRKGCGRETMHVWVMSTHVGHKNKISSVSPSVIRQHLKLFVYHGVFVEGRTALGYRTYSLKE